MPHSRRALGQGTLLSTKHTAVGHTGKASRKSQPKCSIKLNSTLRAKLSKAVSEANNLKLASKLTCVCSAPRALCLHASSSSPALTTGTALLVPARSLPFSCPLRGHQSHPTASGQRYRIARRGKGASIMESDFKKGKKHTKTRRKKQTKSLNQTTKRQKRENKQKMAVVSQTLAKWGDQNGGGTKRGAGMKGSGGEKQKGT